MDIFLYDNTKKEYIKFPVISDIVNISSSQDIQDFDTLGQGNLKLIGLKGNRKLLLKSFFPVKDYSFLKDRRYKGMGYVEKIEKWRESRKYLNIIISDLKINFPCVINNFDYGVQDGSGDIYYTLDIEEYKIPKIKKTKITNKIVTSEQNKNKTQPSSNINYLKNTYGVVTARDGLNVRTGNGIGYTKIGALRYGTKVKLYRLEANGKWWHIYYGKNGGHVSADWIRRI